MMISKEEMLALIRSVAVPNDVEEGMGHAFDLGVDWERARVEKLLVAFYNSHPGQEMMLRDLMDDVKNGVQYP